MNIEEYFKRVYDATNKFIKVGISAGTALIGKVSIDQTTDGTTNKVQARNATHDNFCANANLQVADADISTTNPVNVDTKNVSDAMMGNLGGVYSGAATISPAATYVFNAIQIVTNAVLTCTGAPTGITAIAFESGTTIYGRFSQVVIASGSVIAYQGK